MLFALYTLAYIQEIIWCKLCNKQLLQKKIVIIVYLQNSSHNCFLYVCSCFYMFVFLLFLILKKNVQQYGIIYYMKCEEFFQKCTIILIWYNTSKTINTLHPKSTKNWQDPTKNWHAPTKKWHAPIKNWHAPIKNWHAPPVSVLELVPKLSCSVPKLTRHFVKDFYVFC